MYKNFTKINMSHIWLNDFEGLTFHNFNHLFCPCLFALLEMVRTATPFPMVSLLFVFTAFVISNIGHIRPQRTILAFISGIFFILSGKLYVLCYMEI